MNGRHEESGSQLLVDWKDEALARARWPAPAVHHMRCASCGAVEPGERAKRVVDGLCAVCRGVGAS